MSRLLPRFLFDASIDDDRRAARELLAGRRFAGTPDGPRSAAADPARLRGLPAAGAAGGAIPGTDPAAALLARAAGRPPRSRTAVGDVARPPGPHGPHEAAGRSGTAPGDPSVGGRQHPDTSRRPPAVTDGPSVSGRPQSPGDRSQPRGGPTGSSGGMPR